MEQGQKKNLCANVQKLNVGSNYGYIKKSCVLKVFNFWKPNAECGFILDFCFVKCILFFYVNFEILVLK